MSRKDEQRQRALVMGEDRVPATAIATQLSVTRVTVMKWLKDAGIEPVMLRQQGVRGGGAQGLAAGKRLSIEEGVRKRIEEARDDEAA